MGGNGSGNWYRWDRKTCVEECKSLDIRRWKRDGLLIPERYFNWQWTTIDGEPTGDINVTIGHNHAVLNYRVCTSGEDWQPVKLTVHFSYTPCNYGNQRPWFLCPNCNRRVALLYSDGKYFLCRHCYNLAYSSQSESNMGRLLRKARKVRKRLNADMNLEMPVMEKPKGMHWKTFEKLVRTDRLINMKYDQHLETYLNQLK